MPKGVIVCIDDERSVLISIRDQLTRILKGEYGIELAAEPEEALSLMEELVADQVEVPLIICDQIMPGMGGAELLAKLHQRHPKTLKILLTGLASLENVLQAVNEANLYRFIAKPWNEADLDLTVREALRRYEQEKQLAEQNRILQQMNLELQQMNLELQRENAVRRQAEAQLAHDAMHDALTGLPNRALFLRHLEAAIQTATHTPNYQFAVLFIDLDRFKLVNDSLGHTIGDIFLMAIAHRLQHCLRDSDLVARLGGDEFTVLIEPIQDQTEAIHIAERVLNSLCTTFNLRGHNLFASASVGIVIGSANYQQAADLLRDADLAMYRAKASGRGCYALFNQDLHTQILKLLQLESDLRLALARQEFVLFYQPIVDLETRQIKGFEALLRWQHPQKGLIGPDEFITMAEETGLIVQLGEWVLREACQQLATWKESYSDCIELSISVNLSSKQLREPDLIQRIDQILAETALEGRYLCLELTESGLIGDEEMALPTLNSLRHRNIQLSIDDFGTGYSSLSYLLRFPIDYVKIDRSFISRMTMDSENYEIVRAITTLVRSIGIATIAEGIEDPQQVDQLKLLGCQFGQGYLFSRPMEAQQAGLLLQAKDKFFAPAESALRNG
jgi:diguanylate cyclase (GGDEF)-like protein